jgi:hypothetical protein
VSVPAGFLCFCRCYATLPRFYLVRFLVLSFRLIYHKRRLIEPGYGPFFGSKAVCLSSRYTLPKGWWMLFVAVSWCSPTGRIPNPRPCLVRGWMISPLHSAGLSFGLHILSVAVDHVQNKCKIDALPFFRHRIHCCPWLSHCDRANIHSVI